MSERDIANIGQIMMYFTVLAVDNLDPYLALGVVVRDLCKYRSDEGNMF